jgi:hypothetical protein
MGRAGNEFFIRSVLGITLPWHIGAVRSGLAGKCSKRREEQQVSHERSFLSSLTGFYINEELPSTK